MVTARTLLLPTLVVGALLLGGCSTPGTAAIAGATTDGAGAAVATPRVVETASLLRTDGEPSTDTTISAASLRTVDVIELDAEQLRLSDGDDLVAVAPMTDGDATVGLLRRLLGKPRITRTAVGDGGTCVPASTSYTWGRGLRVVDLAQTSTRGNAVDIRMLKASITGRSGATVHLQGPNGVTVGDDIRERVATASGRDKESYASGDRANWQIVLQEGWVLDPDASDAEVDGVSAITKGTEVAVIGSPMPVHSSDDC
ncbi:hypothetical protein DEI90_05125 [Curtobacterium sp. MCBD17_031]|nr:hypothetical protein DEI90_05125 [Curtobacterium sp. MCBD17_031]